MTDPERRALRGLLSGLVRAAVAGRPLAEASEASGMSGVSGVVSATAAGAAAEVSATAAASGAPAEVSATLAAAVRRHLLAPLAHRRGWPGFRGDHAAAAIQADRRAAALAEAVDGLGRAGIPVMLLKGIAYAGTIYPERGLRPMSDIDLLVPVRLYAAAVEAIGRLGYWHAGTPDQLSGPNHGFSLKRKDGSIDVHRHITHAGRTSIDLDAVWREARPSHVPGALRASAPHEYIIHVAHMARHELAVPAVNVVDATLLRTAAHQGSTCDLEELALRWRVGRGDRAVVRLLQDVESARPAPAGLLPSVDELLEGRRPGRALQVARKLALTDDLRGVAALVSATIRGRLEHLRPRARP